ncbi:MAG: hypothetical protein ACP5HJ_01455 [Candidatus Micrarchaeia archaeon]|jgi:20S proteasome alpha/beta subunit
MNEFSELIRGGKSKNTIIFALYTHEGDVVIASDTLSTIGDIKGDEEKISKLGNALVATAGIVSSCQVFEEEIEKLFEENKEIDREKIRKTFTSARKKYLKSLDTEDEKEWDVEALLVAPFNNKIKILKINTDGSEEEIKKMDFVVIGSGEKSGYTLANFIIKEKLPLKKALTISYLIVDETKKTCLGVGGGTDIWVYTHDKKIKHLTKEEIEKEKEKAEELKEKILKIIYPHQKQNEKKKIRITS